MSKRPAFFLDRDGTINREVNYLSSPGQLILIDGVAQAIRLINQAGWACVIVTNQSAVARGMITEEQLAGIHRALIDLLAEEGAQVDAIYYCPHLATAEVERYRIDCDCRKPKPGLLLKAARELGLDLPRSVVVGDSFRDLEAGRAAGCRTVLVRTGYGQKEIENGMSWQPDLIVADLLVAVQKLL